MSKFTIFETGWRYSSKVRDVRQLVWKVKAFAPLIARVHMQIDINSTDRPPATLSAVIFYDGTGPSSKQRRPGFFPIFCAR